MEPTTRWMLLLLVLPMVSLAQANVDSLQTALDAITRRQRDLSMPPRPSGYYALSQYRHKGAPAASDDEDTIAFLDTARDFAGDGQPENIGYGYQKTVSAGPAGYSAQLLDGPVHSSPNVFGNVLVDYVKDGEPQSNYYQRGIDVDTKRSLFRERGNDGSEQDIAYGAALPSQFGEVENQGNILLPSMFRERFHTNRNSEPAADMEKLRHYATEAIAKQIEAEEEEQRLDNKRNDYGTANQEEEYLSLLQNLWEKYKEANPRVLNAEDFTQNDVEDIIASLRTERPSDHSSRKRQYSYGSGFDLFNSGALMGGWGNGGVSKRNRQRVDGAGQQGGNFLYSLKYVAPESNREAVETLTDGGGIDVPDERDEDILRLASGLNSNSRGDWVYPQPLPVPVDNIYSANDDPYETLLLENRMAEARAAPRHRLISFGRGDNEYHEISPAELLMLPERNEDKRFVYEAKKKRYPVTKRSSNFYASPPMLHHKAFNSEEMKDSNQKKNTMNGVTDPKVAQELNQIFSSSATHDKEVKDNIHKSDAEINTKMTTSDERKELTHETTTTPSVTTSAAEGVHATGIESKENSQKNRTSEDAKRTNHETHTHGTSVHVEKETVEPITMSKIQTPLEIKKKSIDWSDYFGIDKRRKKTAPENNEPKGDGNNMVDDNWLLNQYYKTLAMVSNPLKKRISLHTHETSPAVGNKKELNEPQAYHTDIFARSSQREENKRNLNVQEDSGIDNMDTKLRNMEDLIVNEAVKYTGSREGTEDPKEIQEMKNKILSRLAAAYSLEKMRLALAEFKSSLKAQMMSKYNPENQKVSLGRPETQDENKMKRVAVKKEKAEDDKNEDNDEKKKKRNDNKIPDGDESSGEFLRDSIDVEPMSEGYMGRTLDGYETGCPILDKVLQRCRRVGRMSEDHDEVFVPLCSLHQICNICGPEVGAPSASACDLMFATEADSMCEDDTKCRRSSRRIMTLLRRGQAVNIGGISPDHCSNDSCLAQYFLTSPLPNNQPR